MFFSTFSLELDPYIDRHEYQLDFEESNDLIKRDNRYSANDLDRNSADYLNSPKLKPTSKAVSMPTICSAQLSDISERTEYTTKSHPHQREELASSLSNDAKRHTLRRHSEYDRLQTSYVSDGDISDKSSPNSMIENPKLTVQSSMKNEIEINIHKASTISEE